MQNHSETDVTVGSVNFLNECAVVKKNMFSAVLFTAFLLAIADISHILIAFLQWLLGYVYIYVA
jgi:hypothetical protein